MESPSQESLDRRRQTLRPLTGQARAAFLAALLSMGAYCLAMAVHGTYPFGRRSRAVNDLGNQFVPLHAHLWDLMHGNTTGDLYFNWSSGYGAPFLGDFFTYLMNPFSWLVGIFPRDHVELPVFLVTLFSIGLASGLMTLFLGRLHPGSPWLRAMLSVCFAVSAWTISDGFADPMWMWGLVACPLLGIAYDWCLHRRSWIAGTLLVTLSWAGNYYTAAMATLGMALVLLVRLLLDDRPVRERARALLRAASMTATGVLLAAPVLTVSLRASQASQPAPTMVYKGAPTLADYLAHLFPGGLSGQVPRISVGLLPLLLIAAFPFIRRVPLRERLGWLALITAVAASLVWQPTILFWHGLAMPNGNPYRASIALTAVLVSVAWLALARQPRARELLCGAGVVLVLLLFLGVSGTAYMSRGPWLLAAAGLAPLVLLLALDKYRPHRGRRVALTAALAATVFLTTAYAVFSTTVLRDADDWWRPKRTFDDQSRAAYERLKATDQWSATRTDPGPHEFANNDPMLLAGQGGTYYSSQLPARTADVLHRLGAGWYIQGRHTRSFTDPVSRAIMGISSHLDRSTDPLGFTQSTHPAPPLVTLRPPRTLLDGPGYDDATVFARQERVLGARVYEVPDLRPSGGSSTGIVRGRGWALAADQTGGAGRTYTALCSPGTRAYWYAPWFLGQVEAHGTTVKGFGDYSMTSNGIADLGPVPANGTITATVVSGRRQYLPQNPIGCLDRTALDRAVRHMQATGPQRVSASGHGIDAVFKPGTKGTAVVSVPATPGWRCSVDGARATTPRTLGGLIAVHLGDGASSLSCTFRPPGLRLGLTASAAATAALLLVAGGGALGAHRRGRRSGGVAR
ncbi:YfhO family protein [Streptomyces sp. NPDC003038]|uniref:YfhO family protein n=1 Tax=unclassified Streptomyces TaxID=2593676 RepID=UPI0033B5910A